jgi:hypothetical protein
MVKILPIPAIQTKEPVKAGQNLAIALSSKLVDHIRK